MNKNQERKFNQSVITPLVKQAVGAFKYAFCYLYPYIFEIDVHPNGSVFINLVPFTRKQLPWLLSLTVFTGFFGWGSCLYICITQIIGVERQPWIKWSFFNTIITSGLLLASAFELLCCFILSNSSIQFQAYNELIRLEQKCNVYY